MTHVQSLPESASKAACRPPTELAGKIIRADRELLYVDSSLVRHSIRTTYTYHCLIDRGVQVIDVEQGQVNGVTSGPATNDCISPNRVSGRIIRRNDGISWVVIDGVRRHLPTLAADVCARAIRGRTVALTDLSYDAAASIPEGDPFDCDIENKVIQALDQPQPYPAYRIVGGKRHWIPDGWTFDYWKRRVPVVGANSEAVVKELPNGGTDTRRLDPAAVPARSIIRREDGVSWVVDAHRVRHHIPFARDDVCWRRINNYQVTATGLTHGQASSLTETNLGPALSAIGW